MCSYKTLQGISNYVWCAENREIWDTKLQDTKTCLN